MLISTLGSYILLFLNYLYNLMISYFQLKSVVKFLKKFVLKVLRGVRQVARGYRFQIMRFKHFIV